MEKIASNPGLQHLAEKVFLNLDVDVLKICGQINKSCKQILKQPMFWLRKFGCLSKESQKGWVKIIQSVKNYHFLFAMEIEDRSCGGNRSSIHLVQEIQKSSTGELK